ncbi:tetratricopeptide repeat protein [Streptomyces sp. NPDC056004]|uniref:tetratricopeptide repeat protein n=1 Tax=Streptomyces sp. NPDC056004 TaxID=3345677 RepID=UPI0035D822E2
MLTGTGGVGKTQLAADYARTAWANGEVDVLLWISASSRSAITAGYAQAGAEVLAADPSNPEQAARAFLAWLEPKSDQKPCRWLVVLDDLADPADMRGWWPPTNRHGRALVTTRRREAALTGQGRRRVTVGLFTPQEAADYLTAVLAAHDCHEPTGQINSLATELGYLPLALAQAAAHIIDANLKCSSYRRLLANQIRKLTDLLPEPGALPDDQTTSVAATWALSIERANQLRPVGLARPMLQLAAFLDPNGIPADVLTSQPALAHLTEHRNPPGTRDTQQPDQVSTEDAVLALRALHRLSLIDHTGGTPHQAVRVHQLVQRATRDTLSPEQSNHLAIIAADALTASWPVIERDVTLAQSLRANAFSLARTAEDILYGRSFHPVLFRTGSSLGSSGQAANARDHFHHLAATARLRLGPNHPRTLLARHFLAQWQGEAGDATGAAVACEELLVDQLRELGRDHPDTLNTRSARARWRGRTGNADDAVSGFRDLLRDQVRVLGSDHPDTLNTRHELAHLQGVAGNTNGAVGAYEELLADRVRVLGSDHPDTLNTRHELARVRGNAVAAYKDLLRDQVRVLGSDHPDTLNTRHELAHLQGVAGNTNGAVGAYEELLADRVRVLGSDHPDTLNTRHELAHLQGVAGNTNGAVGAYEELLADRVRVLGPDHPDTLNTRRAQARWRGRAGDVAGAVAAFRELLDDQVRMLLTPDGTALGTCRELAQLCGRVGDADGAASEELLAARLRVLGPDHPLTLSSRGNLLAQRKAMAGNAAAAVDIYRELLPKLVVRLGANHPDTLAACNNLAHYVELSRYVASIADASTELLQADQVRGHAPDHPDIVAAQRDISGMRRRWYNEEYGHLLGFIEE